VNLPQSKIERLYRHTANSKFRARDQLQYLEVFLQAWPSTAFQVLFEGFGQVSALDAAVNQFRTVIFTD